MLVSAHTVRCKCEERTVFSLALRASAVNVRLFPLLFGVGQYVFLQLTEEVPRKHGQRTADAEQVTVGFLKQTLPVTVHYALVD